MRKLKTFFRRMRTMSLKRMTMYAKKAACESKKPVFLILADMTLCTVKYGVGYLDYLTFGFVHQNAAARKTYMTMNDNLRIAQRLNAPNKKELFENKLRFAELFSNYLHRDFLDLTVSDIGQFSAFAKEHRVFFAKEPNNYGGLGVSRISVEDDTDTAALRKELIEKGQLLVEAAVVQHEGMNMLNRSSVNTIRLVTLFAQGKPQVMYSLVRMGGGDSFVDNISSGGMYAPLDHDGNITAPAFCDKTGEYYETHPATGTALVGYRLPYFEEAISLVLEAAHVVKEVRYVGWDVAISETGPVIIEGNTLPSYDMCQNYRHLGIDKVGIKPRFKQVLGDDFD
ncbi:MAG: sugar-transfer associated ATP-grasp domain-containing protein [Oscillospiraceae bacterium]